MLIAGLTKGTRQQARRALIACVAAAVCIVHATVGHTGDLEREYDFDVRQRTLGAALNAIAQQTDLIVLVPSELASKTGMKPVVGRYTVREAISLLLRGTRLSGGLTERGVIYISISDNDQARNGEIDMKDRKVSKSLWASVAALLSGLGAHAQESQQPPGGAPGDDASSSSAAAYESLEEIIVTAQKREQSIRDVPVSITAMSGEKLEQAGIKDIQDLSFAVPSMNVTEQAPGKQIISIRGISSVRGVDSLTGVYLDEIPLTARQGVDADLPTLDLARVEVLKGPQGTLFGGGSVGGTVRFITKDPDLDSMGGKVSTRFFGTSDADWSKEATGILNLPVVSGKFGVRIAADYADEAGWIDQVAVVGGSVIREDINFSESSNVRVKTLWAPTDEFTLKAMALVHRNDFGAENVLNQPPADESRYVQAFFRTEKPLEGYNDYELYNLAGTYDLGFAEVLSSTSYSDMSRRGLSSQVYYLDPATPGGAPILRDIYFANDLDVKRFSQEIRLSSMSSGSFSWTAGIFYQDFETEGFNLTGTYLAHDGAQLLAAAGQGLRDVKTSESWALFADASYRLTDRWEVGAGVRSLDEEREAFNPANVSATFFSKKFDKVTFRSFVSYALTEEARVYVSVADGFRSGDFNLPSAIALGAPATFEPETVISYELGTKFSLSNLRLNVEAALFHSKYKDIQGDTLASAVPVFQYTANAGEAEIKGFEWAVRWAATDRLALAVSGDITDTEVTKIDTTVATPQLLVGDPLNNVAEYSVAVTGDYNFAWSPSIPGFFRMQFYEQGESHSTAREPFRFINQDTAPVVDFLSASIGAELGGWSVEAFGQNLLDERRPIGAGFTNQTPQARPRTIGIKVEKSF